MSAVSCVSDSGNCLDTTLTGACRTRSWGGRAERKQIQSLVWEGKEKPVSRTHDGVTQTIQKSQQLGEVLMGRFIVLSQNLGLVSSLQFHAVKLITFQSTLEKCKEAIL